VRVLSKDPWLDSVTVEPMFNCCTLCNNKEVARAGRVNSVELLERIMKDTRKVSTLN
jgi:hypothetical protein